MSVAEDKITSGRLLREAWRLFSATWHRSLIVWLSAAVLSGLSGFAEHAHLATARATQLTVQMVLLTLSAFATLLADVVATRILLGYRKGFWSLNGDFWRYMKALFVISAICLPFITIFYFGIVRNFGLSAGAVAVDALILFAALAVIGFKSSFWPTGQLIGDTNATLASSWQMTNGITLAMMGAICIVLPIVILQTGLKEWAFWGQGVRPSVPWVYASNEAISVGVFAASTAIKAAAYKLAVRERHPVSLEQHTSI